MVKNAFARFVNVTYEKFIFQRKDPKQKVEKALYAASFVNDGWKTG